MKNIRHMQRPFHGSEELDSVSLKTTRFVQPVIIQISEIKFKWFVTFRLGMRTVREATGCHFPFFHTLINVTKVA
jgi:hypothetical protein